MADENLSLRIEFEELERFVEAIEQAGGGVEDLAGSLDDAGVELDNVEAQADSAAEAIDRLGDEVSVNIDSSDLDRMAGASDDAGNGLDDLASSSQRMAASVEDNLSEVESASERLKERFDSLPPAIQGIVAAFAAFGGLQIVTKFFEKIQDLGKQAVENFGVQELAVVRLGAALGSLGRYSQDSLDDLQAFASGLQQVTTYGDETILKVSALLAQLGRLSGAELKRATEATIQLSAVLGTDLNAAALLMAKAAQGMTDSLSRYGLVLDESIPKSEKFGALLDLIEQQFGGTAQLAAETFSGKVQQLSNSWGDFLEVVGQTAGIFAPALEQLTKDISAINDYLGLSADSVLNVDRAMDKLSGTFSRWGYLAYGIFQQTEEGAKRFASQLQSDTAAQNISRAIDQFEQGISGVELAAKFTLKQGDEDEIRRVIEQLQKLADEAAGLGADAIEERLQALIKLGEETIVQKVDADTRAARNKILELRDLAAEEPVPMEVTLLDEHVRGRVMELEKLRPEIEAEVDFDRKTLDALEGLEYDIEFRAPKLNDEEFIKLATRTREVFIEKFNEGLEEGVDSSKLDEAFRILPLLEELERQRTLRLQVEYEIQGPTPDWREILDFESAEKDTKQLGDLIVSTLRSLGAEEIEVIKVEELVEAGASAESLTTILEALTARIEDQVVETGAAVSIYNAAATALDNYADKTSEAAEATRQLQEASRATVAVAGFWGDLLEEIPGLADDMKNVSQATDGVSEGFNKLDSTIQDIGFGVLEQSLSTTLQGMVSDTQSAQDLMLQLWRTFAVQVAQVLGQIAANEIFGGGGGGGAPWWQQAIGWAVTIASFLKPGAGGTDGEDFIPPPGPGDVTEFVGQVLTPPRVPLPRGDLEVGGRGLPSRRADSVNVNIRAFDTDGIRRSLSSGSLRREIVRLNRIRRM